MLASKKDRQSKLLDIIENNIINTQEELLNMLLEAGVQATQATVSRDIRALQITKTPLPDGGYRYVCPKLRNASIGSKMHSIFANSINSVNCAGNIISIQCQPGMASAVCAAIDEECLDGILGTVAGDDTIFVLVSSNERALELNATISQFVY